ncbi:MAG TPA: c-type cytochrome [Steroidobacteraceae bacterium]
MLLLVLTGLCACRGRLPAAQFEQARGLIANDCATCHVVPGISRARGRVGPSLAGIARQQIIAGHFANTPDTMVRWIEHPQAMLPGDAMPEMGLSREQAQAITNYLYTLE